MADYTENFKTKLDWQMPFQRTGGFPLDRSTMFSSYADAVLYAAGDKTNPDSRGLCGTSYIGQVITVYEADVVTVYKIAADRTLSEVGSATNGDDKSIVLSEGLLSLYGFSAATENQQPRIKNYGTADEPDLRLEWYTPDTSTVSGLQDAVKALQDTVGTSTSEEGLVKDVENIQSALENVYTKEEVDTKLTAAIIYKGSYDSFQALLDAVTAGTIVPEAGWAYNIATAGGTDAHGVAIDAGDNVIYNGTGWDVSSGTVDLSGYYTKTETNTAITTATNTINETINTLTGTVAAQKVSASENNGKVTLGADTETPTEVTVYTLPVATDTVLGGVMGEESDATIGIVIDANGKMTIVGLEGSKISGAVSEASKVTNTLTIGGKVFDGSEAVVVSPSDMTADNVVTNDKYGTTDTAGAVKSSPDQDKVTIEADGTMTVNDVSGSKIKGAVDEASKVTNALTFGEKSFDGTAPKTITAADLGALTTTDAENTYVKKTDIATADTAGIVKSSDAQDTVSVGADGTMTVNDVSGSKIKGAVADATNAAQLGTVPAADILVAGADTNLTSKVKHAAAADQLNTAVNISLTGDVSGNANFDGSGATEITATLAPVGTAGTYTKVTTDGKGRVTAGGTLEAADIPNLTLAKITDAGALAGKNTVLRTDLDATLLVDIENLEAKSHTHANKNVLDGISSDKVADWDDAAAKIDSKADSADTLAGYGITDAYTKTEIDGIVGGAYHYAGTYNTFDELVAAVAAGTQKAVVGSVFNITTAGGTDFNGNAIKAGDNVVCRAVTVSEEDGTTSYEWDVLSGVVDLSAYAKTADVNTAISNAVNPVSERVTSLSERVDTLDTTVLDPETGLVTKVGANTTAIELINQNITNLTNVVGADAESGLRKAVADNTTAIGTLNADETTEGSVRNIVAASAKTINDALTEVTKDGGTIDTKIDAHNTAENAHADLFAEKQNKVIHATITVPAASFAENTDAEVGATYMVSVPVDGLDAGKNYTPHISPAPASYYVVAATKFLALSAVDAGNLILYSETVPSSDIVINGTFIEIH